MAKKKQRISKHVLKAKAEHEKQKTIDGSSDFPKVESNKTTAKSAPKKKRSKHVKDPSEAAMYLKLWEQHKKNGTDWKFNKNTQSWLIRHMYETDKVAKAAFTLLQDYLAGLEGEVMKKHIRAEATKKALRYKEYEKKKEAAEGESAVKESGETSVGNKEGNEESSPSKAVKTKVDDDDEDDAARWKRLDDHEKRKEYKRARQILELIKCE